MFIIGINARDIAYTYNFQFRCVLNMDYECFCGWVLLRKKKIHSFIFITVAFHSFLPSVHYFFFFFWTINVHVVVIVTLFLKWKEKKKKKIYAFSACIILWFSFVLSTHIHTHANAVKIQRFKIIKRIKNVPNNSITTRQSNWNGKFVNFHFCLLLLLRS